MTDPNPILGSTTWDESGAPELLQRIMDERAAGIYRPDGSLPLMIDPRNVNTARLAAVWSLHAPHLHSWGPTCHGCDAADGDVSCAPWPCRMAKILYTDEEIAFVIWLGAERMYHERVDRLANDTKLKAEALVPTIWGFILAEQMDSPFQIGQQS